MFVMPLFWDTMPLLINALVRQGVYLCEAEVLYTLEKQITG